jgi:hypothetical protein
MDRDKMSNLYRGPYIDASYQVSVHIAEGFQTMYALFLFYSCLFFSIYIIDSSSDEDDDDDDDGDEDDDDEKDKKPQKRIYYLRECEKLTDDRRRTKAHIWQGELKMVSHTANVS